MMLICLETVLTLHLSNRPLPPLTPDGILGAITSGGNDSSTTPGDILNQVIGGISGALGTDLQVGVSLGGQGQALVLLASEQAGSERTGRQQG
jgi:hypothetical protein